MLPTLKKKRKENFKQGLFSVFPSLFSWIFCFLWFLYLILLLVQSYPFGLGLAWIERWKKITWTELESRRSLDDRNGSSGWAPTLPTWAALIFFKFSLARFSSLKSPWILPYRVVYPNLGIWYIYMNPFFQLILFTISSPINFQLKFLPHLEVPWYCITLIMKLNVECHFINR